MIQGHRDRHRRIFLVLLVALPLLLIAAWLARPQWPLLSEPIEGVPRAVEEPDGGRP